MYVYMCVYKAYCQICIGIVSQNYITYWLGKENLCIQATVADQGKNAKRENRQKASCQKSPNSIL